MRKNKLKKLLAFAAGLLMVGGSLTQAAPAQANITDGFDPEFIIADENMYNGADYSAEAVQAFLNAKVPNCEIGTNYTPGAPYGNTTIASACLKDFIMNTPTKPANKYCAYFEGRAGETAAQAIVRVAQVCNISPKVLLVMLQKEQSLVTDTWPTVIQYNSALGYGCPDSGPNYSANCNTVDGGFFNQLYSAARQIQIYRLNPDWYNYKAGQNNRIQFHPNPACGSATIFIRNTATAALYIYTPYLPNDAALAAGWGTGDSCSAYGNRNFYNFYKAWFGDPRVVNNGGNNGGGEQPAPAPAPAPAPVNVAIKAGDVITRDAAGNLWNYGNLYPGVYVPRKQIGWGWGGFQTINAVDYTGDGIYDLIGNTAGGQLYLYPGNNAGSFDPVVQIGYSGWGGADVHVVRFNKHDALPQILAKFPNGIIGRFGNDGGRAVLPGQAIGWGWGGFTAINTGYFDGDAELDVIAQTTTGDQLLYRTIGTVFTEEPRARVGIGWNGFTPTTSAHMNGYGFTGFTTKNPQGDLLYYAHSQDGAGYFLEPKKIGWGWQGYYLVRNAW